MTFGVMPATEAIVTNRTIALHACPASQVVMPKHSLVFSVHPENTARARRCANNVTLVSIPIIMANPCVSHVSFLALAFTGILLRLEVITAKGAIQVSAL